MIIEFPQSVKEKLSYYVYVLKDQAGKTFYIGKGKDDRCFSHLNEAIENLDKDIEFAKINKINEIGAENVKIFILRHNLTEKQALEIESACIDLIGLENLTNEVKGHQSWESGLKDIDEVIQLYEAKEIIIEDEHPTLILNINRLFVRFMSDEALYQAVRGSWVVGKDREKVKYVIASYRGLVRAIYKIDKWVQSKTEPKRYIFEGEPASAAIREKYLNKSLKKYTPKKGGANPVKYSFKTKIVQE